MKVTINIWLFLLCFIIYIFLSLMSIDRMRINYATAAKGTALATMLFLPQLLLSLIGLIVAVFLAIAKAFKKKTRVDLDLRLVAVLLFAQGYSYSFFIFSAYYFTPNIFWHLGNLLFSVTMWTYPIVLFILVFKVVNSASRRP
jgi:hypothetical protein